MDQPASQSDRRTVRRNAPPLSGHSNGAVCQHLRSVAHNKGFTISCKQCGEKLELKTRLSKIRQWTCRSCVEKRHDNQVRGRYESDIRQGRTAWILDDEESFDRAVRVLSAMNVDIETYETMSRPWCIRMPNVVNIQRNLRSSSGEPPDAMVRACGLFRENHGYTVDSTIHHEDGSTDVIITEDDKIELSLMTEGGATAEQLHDYMCFANARRLARQVRLLS